MGIFSFLKWFSSEEKEVKEIRLDELMDWIDSYSKKALEDTDLKLAGIKENITKEKHKMEESIQKLEKAKPKNQYIPERAKHMLDGNKQAYLQKVNSLFEKIDLPDNLNAIKEFCNSFDRDLDTFSKDTMRNYHILIEFIGEASGVAESIRDISNLIKQIEKVIENAGIEKIDKVKDSIDELHQEIKQKQDTEEDIKQAREETQKQSKTIEDKERKIKELEQGDSYKEFTELVNKKRAIELELGELEKQRFHSFSVIEPALKKYERLTLDSKLIADYLDNSLKALLNDKELKIVEIAGKIKESILKSELELKESKKERVLQELDEINKNYFESFLSKYNELNRKIESIRSEIEKTTITEDIEDLKEQLIQNKIFLEQNQNKITKMATEADINIDDLKKDLEKEIKESINELVKIS